ncbi:hypothetical protein EMIHUDRAFT_203064 [Emiliania huxleyi CCMP1516]|uniref:Sulfotransferase domain-containing protein n=2 Tax=Emiliania huxleyi TaxID=2903 RepID=A0A0D3K5G7_EMIH1|nr:hypothetical protein EMIHUDRAFT_203064 [Emiliania huxleyi CCMP1516]EOD31002.1 hypothetical protein EMIHUDRAFT_203064 [Emiliania huxleyi CCMP1516]|eukprot:XP_005783431.1 hypothetical protein EMIHUDRAFT_203064 [Emiliania huxleyi CCMP1516]
MAPCPNCARRAIPDTVLLGLPKAGTTSLHACLTDPRRFVDNVCCRGERNKEPRIFFPLLDDFSVRSWPRQRGDYDRVLDFTPNYLAWAFQTLPIVHSVYGGGGRPLHLVLVLRDPVDRAFSEYCMFARDSSSARRAGLSNLRRFCVTPMESSCPPPFSGVCMDDVGWLRRGAGVLRGRGAAGGAGARPGLFHLGLLPSRPGLFHKEFRAAAAAIGAAFPGTLTAEGEVNRSALAWLVWPGGRERPEAAVVERLAALVMPWKDRACQRGWGQDTQHDNATFTEVITAELRRMEECAPPPQRALTMDAPALEGVVRRCFSLRRFQYAAESVPVYQLALYLRRLPPSPSVRWTVLRYEALYASGTPADCTPERMAHRKQYRNRAVSPSYDRPRLDRAFAPWYDALLQLAARAGGNATAAVLREQLS